MTYERVRLGDVLKLERRPVAVEMSSEYVEVGVRSFGKGIFHKEPIVGADLGNKRVFQIEPGDLVISNVFAWEGAIAVASAAESGTIGSHRFMTFRPKDGRIDQRWAAWFLRSERGLDLLRKASPGSAGRNRTLAIERFQALEIPLPPIEEQRRVSRRVDAAQAGAHEVARAFGRLPPEVLRAALPSLVDGILDQHTTDRAQLSTLIDFVSDTVHPGDDPNPADCFIGLQHVESHTGYRLGSDGLGQLPGRKFRFRPGQIVYGYLRPYLNKIWVADRHGLCSVDQYVLQPRGEVDAALLAHALRGRRVLEQAETLTHNLQLPRLRSGLLASIEVSDVRSLVPADVRARLDVLRDEVRRLVELRQRQGALAASIVPAALNEAFAGLS